MQPETADSLPALPGKFSVVINPSEVSQLHYYQHHIGDLLRETANLNDHQLVTYLRMIWRYYDTEKPITENLEDLAFAMRSDERTVQLLLRHYFIQQDDGWHQSRCDREIADYHKKGEKRRSAANARWANANALHTESNSTKNDANQEPRTKNQEPVGKKESPIGDRQPSVDNCPHSEILDLYAKALPQLTQPLRSRWPSSAGANSLRVRWREDKRHQDLKFWEWFFGVVASSPFHLGQNDRGWRADLPWLLERRNFDKMLEKGMSNGH